MAGRMRTSAAGLELIKSFEGFRETATRLPDGRWTIGYGHVRTAREGLTVSQKDAEDLLTYDLKPVEDAVAQLIYAPLMQNQFDALVSLVFNISIGQFRDSDILRNLNAGDILAAANGFDLWRKARLHGQVMIVDALVRRRAAEKGLFLEHPSGPPSAPTPLVKPEMDTLAPAAAQPRPRADDEEAPRTGPAPSGDIAEAVRRLAERTREAITPTPEIPLPLGATVAPPEAVAAREPVIEPPVEAAAQPKTAEEIEHARRVVAERVARILERAEKEIDTQEGAARPAAVQPKLAAKQPEPDVREGLPDFDHPAERAAPRARPVIDDTEIVEPGRDPAVLFAEAERKAKLVNGHAKRIGPISGRFAILAPWIIVLVLSVLGLIIGAVDTFKTSSSLDASVPRAAATLLAVFGVMMLMSVYFIFWNRTSDDI
ncbi:MAG: glycoside hydrolase family protein [Hyphomonadaceae bacterium]|nr:glycoside hydrolase family protein [Hyphomonadaceae bacterium]MBP9234528.1 glycoside hydrolase family protein [Hyphomonadaceae bacterium]